MRLKFQSISNITPQYNIQDRDDACHNYHCHTTYYLHMPESLTTTEMLIGSNESCDLHKCKLLLIQQPSDSPQIPPTSEISINKKLMKYVCYLQQSQSNFIFNFFDMMLFVSLNPRLVWFLFLPRTWRLQPNSVLESVFSLIILDCSYDDRSGISASAILTQCHEN